MRLRAGAARLAAVELREAERAVWLAQPDVRTVLGEGAAARRELADRATELGGETTAELPAVHHPQPDDGLDGVPVAQGASR